MRMPISKQRNKHIQQVLVEAAKLAPRYSPRTGPDLRTENAERQSQPRHAGRSQEDGCLMLAVERRQQDFVPAEEFERTAAA